MEHPDDLSRNLEAMSMSSLATEIASPPPPPPPLGLERFHSLSKNYGKSHGGGGGGFSFIKSFNEQQHNESYNFGDTLRSRGGEKCSRYSRESSVASDKSESSVGSSFSIASKSSTLSRLFSKKGRAGMVSRPLFGRSASIDSVSVTSAKQQGPSMMGGAPTWSTPGTPNPSESYGLTLRGRSRERTCPATPTLGDRIRHAWNNEKQKVGMSLSEPKRNASVNSKPLHRVYLNAVRRLMSNDATPLLSRTSRDSSAPTSSSISSSRKFGENLCPSCRMPFDKAKKRRLVDTCGHERCYACMFRNETCPICVASDSSPAKVHKPLHDRPLSVSSTKSSQIRSFSPFRATIRSSQNSGGGGVYGSVIYHNRPPQTRLRCEKASTKNDQHSHESGFQSATSLNSLEGPSLTHKDSLPGGNNSPPGSTLTGSTTENDQNLTNRKLLLSAESYNSLASSYLPRSSMLRQDVDLFGGSGNSSSKKINIIQRNSRVPALSSSSSRMEFVKSQPYSYCSSSLKPLFFEVPNACNEAIFVGRQWLYREISEYIGSDLPTNRGVVIVGAPGTGKTTIVLQLVEYSCFGRAPDSNYQDMNSSKCSSPVSRSESIYRSDSSLATTVSSSKSIDSMKSLASQVVAYHFCQADNAPTCLVPEFIHSIAAQMSQSPHLTPYYQYILSDSNLQSTLSLAGCVSDPSGALIHGILEPLNSLRRLGRLSGQTCIILIDGLCEAEIHRPDYGDTLATFLCKHLLNFPPWLKIVCTVRTSHQEVTKLLPFQRISLDKTDVDERLNKDMSDYLTLRINKSPALLGNITPTSSSSVMMKYQENSPQIRFTHFMLQASHGCFLYVKMVLDLIERGFLVIKSSSFNVLPMTLSEIYLLEFNLKFPSTKAYEKVQDILATALASLVPMTPVELFSSINAMTTGPQLQWGEFLMRFTNLTSFLIRRADDTVMFIHPTFREWLYKRKDGPESQKFLCDPRNGHAAIALRMSRVEAPLNPDRTLDLGHHILKAHLYKNMAIGSTPLPPRDLQAIWVAQSTEDLSLALGSVRNVASPNTKVSRLLLLAGASPDSVSDYLDRSPLMGVFANQGFADMVTVLIEFGGNVNASNANGKTPLMLASSQGHGDIVRLLLQHGAVVNLTDKKDQCALVQAAEHGHLDVLNLLINCDWLTNEINDLSLSEAAQQAAVAAAKSGHEQILEFLLDMQEVTVNGADTLSGDTCLVSACHSGQRDCCNILLRRGAKTSVTNLSDCPPLHAAVSGGHWDITEILLKEGANMEQRDHLGRTALIVAAAEGHSAVVEHLLTKKASLEAVDKEGKTALSWASLNGQVHSTNCLLDNGSNISHADKKGCSPLDLAASNGKSEVVQLLLEKGANMEHVDIEGIRPLDRAIAEGHANTVSCFLRKGAKLGPATWAMAHGKPELLLILLNKLLDDGNTLYRREKYDDAAHRYQYAIRRLPESFENEMENSVETFQQLRTHLLLNLSRCRRKQGQFIDAIAKATEVLNIKPECLEALHARARAHREAGNFRESVQDLNEALKVSPQNRDLYRMILKVKEEMSKNSTTNHFGNNNNNGAPNSVTLNDKELKFVDDSSSEVTTSSSLKNL